MSQQPEVIQDLFGDTFEAGSFFTYCAGAQRRVNLSLGIFLGTIKKEVPEHNPSSIYYQELIRAGRKQKKMVEKTFVQVCLIKSWHSKLEHASVVLIPAETFQRRSVVIDPYFRITSPLIKQGLNILDELKDQGFIK